jgi:hypothetical protein
MRLVVDIPDWYYKELQEFKHPTFIDKALIDGIPLTKITSEIEELADFHSVKIPVTYGDGTQTEEKYIDLSELGIILRETEGNDEEEETE